jgi:hypothetical protein
MISELPPVKDLSKEEIWKDIPDYEGMYQVSDLGRVKSLKRITIVSDVINRPLKERILKLMFNSSDYLYVTLTKVGFLKKNYPIHQLVAFVFKNHKPCGHKLVINHINFIKTDNRVVNLEIVINRENCNKKHLKSTSKYTGVSWNKKNNKWASQIMIEGRNKHIGYFRNELEASNAYQNELKKILENGKDTI